MRGRIREVAAFMGSNNNLNVNTRLDLNVKSRLGKHCVPKDFFFPFCFLKIRNVATIQLNKILLIVL